MDALEAPPPDAARHGHASPRGPATTSPDEPVVRLDGLDPGRDGASFRFRGFRRAVAAYSPGDVVPAIREVERAVADGLHAAGFLAYEAAAALEPRFATRPPHPALPLLWFGLFDERVEVTPRGSGAEAAPGRGRSSVPGPDGSSALDRHADGTRGPDHDGALDVEVDGASDPEVDGALDPDDAFALTPFHPSVSEERFHAAVERIREYTLAGDTYQVNHTFRLRAAFRGSEAALYRHLCRAQRAAYCAYLRLPRFSILSASPELFFRWAGAALELRPMKGTRPRGRWPEEDDRLAAELVGSEKERAENLMIVDLLRNDAGRIATYGSVHVPELFRVERYPTVHQLTSTVRARTRPGTTLLDVLRALFPSGSVTGAPKLRTSEIIAELEDSPRGVYTGAIGSISPGGAVFSVAIRTLVLDRETGHVELGIGAGITSGSDAAAEHRECLAKAAFVRVPATDFRLLESMRYEPADGYFLLDGHLARLERSARYFGFRFDPERARERLEGLARGLGGGVHKVRLLLDRGGGMEVESEPIPAASGPARVGIAPEPVDEHDPFLYHKTTRRDIYRSRAASRAECDDVLLVNRRGELTEATTANLVLQLDGTLVTPPVEAGLLPGVFRAHLLERKGIAERPLVPADLERAEAVFLINSVRRWRGAMLV